MANPLMDKREAQTEIVQNNNDLSHQTESEEDDMENQLKEQEKIAKKQKTALILDDDKIKDMALLFDYDVGTL